MYKISFLNSLLKIKGMTVFEKVKKLPHNVTSFLIDALMLHIVQIRTSGRKLLVYV